MNTQSIIGAIAGDIIGSTYEFCPVKKMEFGLFKTHTTFTDDTVMTLANAQWLTDEPDHSPSRLVDIMHSLGKKFPDRGYGGHFRRWLINEDTEPYNSYGNGSAMRVSPIGFYAKTLDETLRLAKISAEVTHNHPEGIKGAQATAASIFMARQGASKTEIRDYIESTFQYDLHRTVDEMRPRYNFTEICQTSVPESIICYLESDTWEETVRKAISMGGDADTMACIAGGIAAATPGMSVPDAIADRCYWILDPQLRQTLNRFDLMLEKRKKTNN